MFMAVTCERPVDITFPNPNPELVVISNFTKDQDIRVQISLTRPLDEPLGIDYIINAQIKLIEDESFIQQLEFVQPEVGTPYFTSKNFLPAAGNTYSIEVNVPGFDQIIARSTIPFQTPIQHLEVKNIQTNILDIDLKEYNFNLQLDFNDPAGEKNYYHLKIFQQFEKYALLGNDTIIDDTSIRELLFSSSQNNNFQVAHYEGGLLVEDIPFDGTRKQFNLPLSIQVATNEERPGKVIAELRTVSESYYLFYSSVSRQRLAPTSPIAEPILIYNNIENGNGVFSAYSQAIDSIPIRSQ